MASHPQSYASPVLAITYSWRGRSRTLKAGRLAAVLLCAVLPLLSVWYFGATAYLVFHDELLASLITRQADMQYSYEDRIAVLRSQLERESSRALVERQTLSTTLEALSQRGERLEARTAAIDAIVRESSSVLSSASGRDGRIGNPLLSTNSTSLPGGVLGFERSPAAAALRSEQPADPDHAISAPGEKHVEATSEEVKVASTFSKIEARQAYALNKLRDPMLSAVHRMRTALEGTGLPAARWNEWHGSEGVGGPYIPLSANAAAMTFEQNLTLLRDTIDYHRRLSKIIDKVPLRQPLSGRLEVTSPFGARLDPFYGRAAMHTGMDFMGAYGTAVRATAGGVVTISGKDGGYGQMVEIDHGNGLATRYAHLSAVDVAIGEHVTTGTIVGRIGSTGRATGPHLHYETRVNGEAVDPARFLKAGTMLPTS